MEEMMKECPQCAEPVRSTAQICRYCHGSLSLSRDGQTVKVRVKGREKVYWGDLFVPAGRRTSDTINDDRQFIILTNAMEETKTVDLRVGFLAVHKSSIEWVRLIEPVSGKEHSRTLED
jgi:hypothetical protein